TVDGTWDADDVSFTASVDNENSKLAISVNLSEDNPGIARFELRLVWDDYKTSFTSYTANADYQIAGEIFNPTNPARTFTRSASYDQFRLTEDGTFSTGGGTFAIFKYDIAEDLPDGDYSVKVTRFNISSGPGAMTVTPANPQYLNFAVARHEAGTPVESIELDPETASVPLGGSLTLDARVLPEDAANKGLRWESSDTAIATVADGVVTPKAVGTTTITATAQDGSGVSASCEVTVYQPVIGVALYSKSEGGNAGRIPFLLEIGDTSDIFVRVFPEDAADKSISSMVSDDEDVATVSFVEDRWMVSAVAPGMATITATTTDGGFTSAIHVVVEATDTADKPVAAIDDVEYDTLDAAFAAGQDGDTIVLLRNQFYGADLLSIEESTCSLDFNGYTLYVRGIALTAVYQPSGNYETVVTPQISNGTLVLWGDQGLISDGRGKLSTARSHSVEKLNNMVIYGGVVGGITIIEDCTIDAGSGIGLEGGVRGGIYGDTTIKGATAFEWVNDTNIYGGTFIGLVCQKSGGYNGSLYLSGGRFDTLFYDTHLRLFVKFGPSLRLSAERYEDGYYHVEEYEAFSTATFTLDPADATVEVTDAEGTLCAPSEDDPMTYVVLQAGSYQFTVSKEGYDTKAGSFQFLGKDSLALEVSLVPTEDGTIQYVDPGDIILFGGTYYLRQQDANDIGNIAVLTTEPVEIVGKGIGPETSELFKSITFNCVEGANMTICDLWMYGILDFTGASNTLTLKGENVLETLASGDGYGPNGFIHAAKGTELVINGGPDGTGTLYAYKDGAGAGIGGFVNEPSGTITIQSGHIFIKGTRTGPCIGGDGGMTSFTLGIPNDPITIAGGEVVLVNKAWGDAIGDGYQSSSAGPVFLKGGNLTIIGDWQGDAIGRRGSFTMTGGSFRATRTGNSLWGDYTESYQVLDYSKLLAPRLTADGEAAYVLAFDTAQLSEAADSFDVSIDGVPFYSGGLHRFYYGASTTYTPDNFDIATPESTFDTKHGSGTYYDTNLYFLVSQGTHELTVNGEDFEATWNSADTRYADSFTVAPAGSTDPGPDPDPDPLEVGDLDGDGSVTALDAVKVGRIVISGPGSATAAQLAAADIDGDGVLTMADVVRILRKAAGLP
ncbi:MAG: Ig-like domain-containing protein, partial [Coriobacteriales bacterium]|nr:Ig-like domain-containing protein [Coriobacteriales bacterium]